ncbi:MAG: hypothetical protein IBJ18_13235 [Phycisphaerales bacterium]|nr:hypothetical protein [Phycisphaerales bacterium]
MKTRISTVAAALALVSGSLFTLSNSAALTAAEPAAASTSADSAAEKVKAYTEKTLVPYFNSFTELKDELKAANAARKTWAAYSEDWKKWTPAEAEKNKDSFTYGEYLWSAKKDKTFRSQHTSTKAAEAMKTFQTKSAGAVAECFVTDAKGANVVQTAITSDWFQGDEEKFTKVENKKDCFYPAPKRDDTVGQTGVQVSIPIWDNNEFIGVAVVLVIAEKIDSGVASAEGK